MLRTILLFARALNRIAKAQEQSAKSLSHIEALYERHLQEMGIGLVDPTLVSETEVLYGQAPPTQRR